MLKHIALAYLIAVIAFFSGFHLNRTKSLSDSEISLVNQELKNKPSGTVNLELPKGVSQTSNTILLASDLNPEQFPEGETGQFSPSSDRIYSKVSVQGLHHRRDLPLLYLGPDRFQGYRAIYGTFDFLDKKLHGIILLNNAGQVTNIWKTTEQHISWEHQKDSKKFPNGFTLLQDGSALITFDRSTSLQKIDACSHPVWATPGKFGYSISLEESKFAWTTLNDNLIKFNIQSGDVLKKHSIIDIMNANPDIDIFGIKQKDRAKTSSWTEYPFHLNDVDPLPSHLAPMFPQFKPGDLLVSLRNINLVFVVNPNTLQVLWWRFGEWRRQHDPDWTDEGLISVFDNQRHHTFSRIVTIDPNNLDSNTSIQGELFDFNSDIRGKHQRLNNGNILITSSQQGRVFEISPRGTIEFEFINQYSAEDASVLVLSEAQFYPTDYFTEDAFSACTQ